MINSIFLEITFALLIFLGIDSLSGQSTARSNSHFKLSITTQLPVINNALNFLNQSPISQKKLTNQKYLDKKITGEYLSTAFGLVEKTNNQLLAQEFLDTIEALKKNFMTKRLLKKKKFKFSLYNHPIGVPIKFVI